jgi:long-chain acyl-CoA synthetase
MKNYESKLRPDRGLFPLSELSANSARDFGTHPALRIWSGNGYREVTFDELHRKVQAIARWLIGKGVKPGDRVAVLGANSPEWGIAYLGIQTSGAVTVPVDSLLSISGIRHNLVDSEAKYLFTTPRFLQELAEVSPVTSLEGCVNLGPERHPAAVDLTAVIEEGASSKVEIPPRTLDDLSVIVYTSGTTGHSKGVMLTQRNLASNVAAISRLIPLGPTDTFLSVLPLHHTFECTGGFLLPMYCGCSVTYARSMKSAELIDDIRNTNVTVMVAVPLLYEKMQVGLVRGIRKKGKLASALYSSLMRAVKAGEKTGLDLGGTLFKKIRDIAGLGTVRYFVSGGGPLDPSVGEFFIRFGIKLLQGYGMTETSPVTHVNPPWRIRNVTVGHPIMDVECRLAEVNEAGIGEVEIKGPNVFAGYYNNPEATREVLSDDGWLKTGDLGLIDPDGYLEIKGRKKNTIVTGGGKNVYPEEIEHYLNRQRFISESLVLGVTRESGYGEDVGALIYPDFEQIDAYLQEDGGGRKATPEEIQKLIRQDVDTGQAELAEYKRVRRFRIIDEEFQKTSTRKIKRFLYKGDMVKM